MAITYYIVESYNVLTERWNYMNSYITYSEAWEARERMKKRYPGIYRIRQGE